MFEPGRLLGKPRSLFGPRVCCYLDPGHTLRRDGRYKKISAIVSKFHSNINIGWRCLSNWMSFLRSHDRFVLSFPWLQYVPKSVLKSVLTSVVMITREWPQNKTSSKKSIPGSCLIMSHHVNLTNRSVVARLSCQNACARPTPSARQLSRHNSPRPTRSGLICRRTLAGVRWRMDTHRPSSEAQPWLTR